MEKTITDATPSLSPLLVLILQNAGPFFALSLQLSSFLTAQTILTNSSVGGLPALPFVSLFTNSLLWTSYGSMKSDYTILVPNLVGVVVGFYCSVVYHAYCSTKPTELYIAALITLLFVVFAIIADNVDLLGTIGACLCIVLFASPLSTMKTVIVERSTSSMSFGFTVAIWCNCVCWSAYGFLLAHDAMVTIPNTIGLALSTLQLTLFLVFGMPDSKPQRAISKDKIVL